jgi:hypothetical protein
MRDMPDMTRQEIPIGSRQVSPLFSFQGQNGGSNLHFARTEHHLLDLLPRPNGGSAIKIIGE